MMNNMHSSATWSQVDDEVTGKLVQVWTHVFDLERIEPDDNFYALGGDSLLAMKLASAMSKTLGLEIPLKAIYDLQTIRKLSCYLEGRQKQRSV